MLDNPSTKSLEEQYPIEKNLKLWMDFKPGVEDEKAQILLIGMFQTLVNRLKHYRLKMAKYDQWGDRFIVDIIANLDFINENTLSILDKKPRVEKWDKEWGEFFDELSSLFRTQFVTMRSHATQVLIIYKGNNIAEIVKFDKDHPFDPEKLENLKKLFSFFEALTKSYEEFIRSLEGSVNKMVKVNSSSTVH